FINIAIGEPKARTSDDILSCTHEIDKFQVVSFPSPHRIFLVDTPGFNHTYLEESEVFDKIADWLKNIDFRHLKIAGIIFLHDITQTDYSSLNHAILTVQMLSGYHSLRNVILTTADWSDSKSGVVLEQRERRLANTEWGNLTSRGARDAHFLGTKTSAWTIIESILTHLGLIDVIGVTGVGKSTFVNTAIGKVVTPVGHGLESCTSRIQHAFCACPSDPSRRVVLVDTPGFDNAFGHDSEILRRIAVWLASSYGENMKLAGIIYLHDICDPRLHMSLDTFRRLHGEYTENYATLATTKWSEVATEAEERREQLLKSLFRQEMVAHGSEFPRFRGSHVSAWDIITPIL
ncbi:uncharacterized protein F5147DRAFT_524937, partial [Suillus discolor]